MPAARMILHLQPLLRFTLAGLMCLTLEAGHAQYQLVVKGSGQDSRWASKKYASVAEAQLGVRSVYTALQSDGYLDVRLDTLLEGFLLYCTVQTGPRYHIGRLDIINDSTRFVLPEPTYSSRKARPLSGRLIDQRMEMVLRFLEDRGYPFAALSLQTLEPADTLWNITYSLSPGPLILFDSLIIKSNEKLPRRFIQNYLGWKSGEPYREQLLGQVRDRLSEIPFITVKQPPEIGFRRKEADLYVYLSKKKANTFNGILGIQPVEGGGVTLTGDLEIKLLNAFQTGEEVYFNWRRLQSETQELVARTRLPYLFNTPFGTEGWIRIYRRDSTFSSMKAQLAFVFGLARGSEVKLFAERNTTTRLSGGSLASDLANVNATLYGVSILFQRLDYRFNPRKGISIEMEGASGRRKALRPANPEGIASDVTGTVFRAQSTIDGYLPVTKRQTVRIGAKGAWLESEQLSENELYRIGGLRTLRGIDEEGIFARSWFVGTVEYRFILERNSAIYIYADQGWYEAERNLSLVTDTPLGYGAGIFFETKAGIFTFNYGLARQFDNPVLLRNARLSFGFRNLF